MSDSRAQGVPLQFKPGDIVGGYVLAEDNQWYPQPPPWQDPARAAGRGVGPPQDGVTARSQPPSDHQRGPVPLRPPPPRPLYALWWWWAGIGVLVVLAGVVSGELYLQAYGYGLWTRRPSVNAPTQPAIAAPSRALEPVPAGGQGQGLRDGEVEFTVVAVDCSQSELGLYTKARAQGHYCLLNVQATNLGTVPVSLPTAQTAYSSDGLWLFPDYLAQTYLSGSSLYSTQLEPSSTASGPLVFDVPTGTTLKSVRLKARTGSNGVVVKLN